MSEDGGDQDRIAALWRARKKEEFADKVEALTAVDPKLARAVQDIRDEAYGNEDFNDDAYDELFKAVLAKI